MLGLRGVMVKNKYVSRRVILTMELAETHYISIHTSKYWHLIGGRGGVGGTQLVDCNNLERFIN